MSSNSNTLEAELMDGGMSGNVTPAKRGSEAEKDAIQAEKQPKLTHEKSPIETSQQHEHPHVPVKTGNEVEAPKYKPGERRPGFCQIHDCNTDHTTFSCPDGEKYFVLYNGGYVLDFCDLCKFDHVGHECPRLSEEDMNYGDLSGDIFDEL